MMIRSTFLPSALGALLLMPLLSSCNLIDVTGDEQANSGRGAKVFDPYQAAASGAIKLSLQVINGCAYTPSAGFIQKNSLDIPYPATCANLSRNEPFSPSEGPLDPLQVPPQGKMTLVSNTSYFLNQISISDAITNKHKNPENLQEFVTWAKTETRLKNLDWSNLGKLSDEWLFIDKYPGIFPVASWTREVLFDNANWMVSKDDSFLIEVLDAGGVVRAKQTYSRSEFLGESPTAGHTRIGWRMENVMAPKSPDDKSVRAVPSYPGNFPVVPTFRSLVRFDIVGSANPFKTLDIDSTLEGDGALRLTWSQLPNEPFYFPVSFVAKKDLEPSCWDDEGKPKACGFGLKPELTLVEPANKKFYVPGESVQMLVDYRDDEGNRLHPPGIMPSGEETLNDKANGLLSLRANVWFSVLEQDAVPMVQVAGPLQSMKVHSEVTTPRPFVMEPPFTFGLVSDAAAFQLLPSLYQFKPAARVIFKVPPDAQPGTYVVFVKGNRYFMGERLARHRPFFFQVGQEQLTSYPGQVGNCQICHRGPLSLDNLRHGLSVDHVEGCKGCHNTSSDQLFRSQELMHRIHMRSKKYTANKNECNVCHLTRASALRPSLALCASCHPSTHSNQFFDLEVTSEGTPNRFSNCAQACHGEQPPKGHILPEN